MDWNDRMTQVRTEYQELEQKENEIREQMQNVIQQGNESLGLCFLRKSQLEGQMTVISELLSQDESPEPNRELITADA